MDALVNSTNLTVEYGNSSAPTSQGCMLYSFVVNTIFIGTLCVLGIVGNMVAYVVFWKDTIKTSTTFLFQGLSLIDTILLITAFPLYVLEPMSTYLQIMPGFVQIMPYLGLAVLPCAWTAQTATIWVTVLVGFNRFIAVCKPYRAPSLCNISMARKYLLVTLICSVLYNIPRFVQYRLVFTERDNGTSYDVSVMPSALDSSTYFKVIYGNIMYLIFLLILPLFTLTVLNAKLIKALKALKRKRMEMQSLRQQQDNNVTFVLIIVVLVFTVCQLPALVNQVLWTILPDSQRDCGGFQYYFSRICNLLVIVNSAINFLIYFLFNTRFRQVFADHFMCKNSNIPTKNGRHNGHLSKTNETTQTLL